MKYVPPVGGASDAAYVDGDPSAGVEGSAVPAAAIEHPMREIVAVIQAAALTPSSSEMAQLLAAINSLISGFAPGPGSVIFVAKTTAPAGFLKANGAAISRTTYAGLFAAIGTTFGVGDGSTTFNLPDLRGEFLRGWDDSRGVDADRTFGSSQSSANLAHTHAITAAAHFISVTPSGNTSTDGDRYSFNDSINDGGNRGFDLSAVSSGGTEARPRNIALLACIKY